VEDCRDFGATEEIKNRRHRTIINAQTNLLKKVVQRRFQLFGRVEERMPLDRNPHNALRARFEGKRINGGPTLRRIEDINAATTSMGVTLKGAMDFTNDRGQRKSFIGTHSR